MKARHLPENLAERGTRIHLGRFVHRADLEHHSTVPQLLEPASAKRIVVALLLREDELLQQIAVPVGDRDLVSSPHPAKPRTPVQAKPRPVSMRTLADQAHIVLSRLV